jgi:chromosomal replication initiation ATPase DnaA
MLQAFLEEKKMLHSDEVIMAVIRTQMPCGAYVKYGDVMSASQKQNVVEARNLICVLLYQFMWKPSSLRIGRVMHRHHSTVLHAVASVKRNEAYYHICYNQVREELQRKVERQLRLRNQSILSLQELVA